MLSTLYVSIMTFNLIIMIYSSMILVIIWLNEASIYVPLFLSRVSKCHLNFLTDTLEMNIEMFYLFIWQS